MGIEDHKFEDESILCATRAMGNRLFLNLENDDYVQITKEDVIALARHYGLLTEAQEIKLRSK